MKLTLADWKSQPFSWRANLWFPLTQDAFQKRLSGQKRVSSAIRSGLTAGLCLICFIFGSVGFAPTSFVSSQELSEDETLQRIEAAARGFELSAEEFPVVLNRFAVYLDRSLYREQPEMQLLLHSLRNVPAVQIGPETEHQFHALDQQRDAFRMVLDQHQVAALPANRVEVHPSAKFFPGIPIQSSTSGSKTNTQFNLDKNSFGWICTGLYAVPGELIEVTIPESLREEGWLLRIGCHSNELPLSSRTLKRFFHVDQVVALNESSTQISSQFGGLIYFEKPLPETIDRYRYDSVPPSERYSKPSPSYTSVRILGGINAPVFELDSTSNSAWRDALEDSSAPWAELSTERIVLTVPTSLIRELQRPDVLLQRWDNVIQSLNRFMGRVDENPIPIRIVLDVQTPRPLPVPDYPIVIPMHLGQELVSPSDPWHIVRAIATCYEPAELRFSSSRELHVRVLTLFALQDGLGIRSERLGADHLRKMLHDRLARPQSERDWNQGGEIWEKLAMYSLIVSEFGWSPMQRVFSESSLAPLGDTNSSEEQKAGEFMLRICRVVKQDLSPLFIAWGVQIDAESLSAAKSFPTWQSLYLLDGDNK